MNPQIRRWAGFLVVQCAVLFSALPLAAQEAPVPSDRRFPIDTLVYFSVRSVTDLKAQWNKSLLGQLGREEGLAGFLQDVDEQFKKLSADLERETGVTLTELSSIPHGEIAAALVQAPGGKLGLIALLDFGEHRELVLKLVEKGVAAAVERGTKQSSEDFEDTEIHSLIPPAETQNRKSPFPMQPCYFVRDSFFVLANHPDVVKTVISRWDGKNERVLANNDTFKYIGERCRDENQESAPLLSWYIDPIGIVKTAVAAGGQNNLQAAMVIGFLPTLGLDRFRGAGGTFDMVRGDFDSVSRTLVMMDPPVQGVLNVFQFPPESQSPPKWVPATASNYMTLNWDVAKAYTAVESLVDTFLGPGTTARKLQEIADNAEAGNIHIQKDLLDHLAGKFHVVSESRPGDELAASRYLVALETKNAAAMRKTLAKVANIEGFPGKTREFQGETIYEISTGDVEDDEAGFYIGLAVTEGHLMIATDVKALEQVMRGAGDREPLAESPEYKKIAARFPAQTSMISFQRQDAQLKAFYDLLKSERSSELFGGNVEIDFSKLPPFETIRKYLPPSGSYMEPDRRGLRIISFSLKKEGD